MSWRELAAYIDWLPQESAYRTHVRDAFSDEELAEIYSANTSEKHGPWSKQELLTAQLIWQVQQLVYVQLLANGAKNVAQPEPIRTPGQASKVKRVSPEQRARAVTYLADIRARHEQQETG